MVVVIDKLRNTCVKHIIIHSLSKWERKWWYNNIPSSNKHITCDEVRRGDQCPEFFFVPNTYGKIILPIHFIHPSPKTSKNMHNNNGASSFFTFGEGSNAQKFFRKYLYHISPLPGHKIIWQRGERPRTQNLFLYNSFSTPKPTYFVFRTWHLFH